MPGTKKRWVFSRDLRFTDLPLRLRFGGRWCTLRLLRPDDQDRLIAFFETHTAETIHQRYGYLITEMTPVRAAQLVGPDQTRDCALGIFEGRGTDESIVAIGRYCLLPKQRAAEVAFVVREDRRQLGMATTLLRVLMGIARERGLTQIVAQVQRDNYAMLELFRRQGAELNEILGSEAIDVSIPLQRASYRESKHLHPRRS